MPSCAVNTPSNPTCMKNTSAVNSLLFANSRFQLLSNIIGIMALVSITITNPNASYPKLNVSPKAILFELASMVCVSGSKPLR